ncbi:MAG TPA: GNAT family N-acetyltransferase [Bacteroidales bacterium]|nr:GNAT family N-acetyltransferase [Bacteroidales bacterium]
MLDIKKYDEEHLPGDNEKKEVVSFLYEHLDQYGDVEPDIERSVDYSLNLRKSFGGFILTATDDGKMLGAVVVNGTGMKGYIPENILVYIATHKDARGKGIGKKLMERAISEANGDIALHVEPDNPARFLYEKYGFTNKYLEMRYKREKA